MFCAKCGSKIEEDSKFCSNCGSTISEVDKTKNSSLETSDSTVPSFVWGIVGALVPLAGLILFVSWKDTRPDDAKIAGISALIAFIVLFIVNFIIIFLRLSVVMY